MELNIDGSLQWMIDHWYYFILAIMTFFMVNWYTELQKLKNQFVRWSDDRIEQKTKDEPKVNPSQTFKWLVKQIDPIGRKTKLIGKISSMTLNYEKIKRKKEKGKKQEYETVPIKQMVIETRAVDLKLFKLAWGEKRIFLCNGSALQPDIKKKTLIVPFSKFWVMSPTGEWVLNDKSFGDITINSQHRIMTDLNKLATDGYGAQMTNYSSVLPKWGHEERMKEKDAEAKALGFGRFLKQKKKGEDDSES